MDEYDYDYERDRRRGPSFPLYTVHSAGSLPGAGFWIVLAVILYCLFG